MHYYRQLVVVLAVLALTYNPLYGQGVGDRLRVKTTDGRKLTGTVLAVSPSSFSLNLDGGGSQAVSFSQIKRLEKRVGETTYKKQGFIYGTVIGSLALGLSLGAAAGGACDDVSEALGAEPSCGGFGAVYFIYGAVVGVIVPGAFPLGLLGAAIGSGMKTDQWATVDNPRSASRFQLRPMLQLSHVRGNSKGIVGARLHF